MEGSSHRQLKVFLCHAHEDKAAVRDLYHRLRDQGVAPWFDEADLLPGQDWELEIRKAVRASDAIIVCLSRRSVTKEGFVQKEIRFALDVADEKPPGTIFLIPLRLEDCDVPEELHDWQWEDLYEQRGFGKLMRSLRARARKLGLEIIKSAIADIEWIRIPAGEFLMGSNDHEKNERPERRVYLDDYYIGKYPVTNEQYRRFVEATSYGAPLGWDYGACDWPSRPVVGVTWYDVQFYCAWAGLRLPTEAQWEKAARGTDGRLFPWGNEPPNARKCNFEDHVGAMTEIGSYPEGASPYGCLDMAGTVWEWCEDWYGPYDKAVQRNPSGPDSGERRVLRGGSWDIGALACRCACRGSDHPLSRTDDIGFRVARPLP
jgi:formylglycine-generating enzyme required for sulfatase activity